MHARVAYWQQQTQIHIPKGTTIADARNFFATYGLELRCCMSGPDIHDAYSVTERTAGRFALTEYSVLVVADVSANQTVDRVRVFRIGVGLECPAIREFAGRGKRMRHVKLRPGAHLETAALGGLIDAAYLDIRARVHG
jgi:hypothetical protein